MGRTSNKGNPTPSRRSIILPVIASTALSIILFSRAIRPVDFDSQVSSETSKATSATTSSDRVTVATQTQACLPNVVYRAPGLPAIKKRNDLGWLLEEKGFDGAGVEVGVQQGLNALEILKRWKSCQTFGLVDLWAKQENYNDYANEVDHDTYLNTTKANLQAFQSKLQFYRMKSVDAAPLFANYSLDFIYLDARHDYCAVTEDLEYYWPKLRPGGIIAGHDYIYQRELPRKNKQDWSLCADGSKNPKAVRGAVEDFAMREGVTITVTYSDFSNSIFQTWIMQKPTIRECVQQ